MAVTDSSTLPDYAPVPKSALGPAVNDQGYYVGRVERNLYWVTDGVYQCRVPDDPDGVVLFDAPPTIGHNLQRAIDEIAAANGVSNKVTHLVHSHHHADHAGAFVAVRQRTSFASGTRRRGGCLLRDNDPARPAPTELHDRRTLEIGGDGSSWRGTGPITRPTTAIIHFPDHDTLMLVDIVNAGWVPVYILNLTEDIPGYIEAPGHALTLPVEHLISGHLGRLGTRTTSTLHQQYIADLSEQARSCARHRRSDALFPEIRRRTCGPPSRATWTRWRRCRRARHREVHRRAGSRRRRSPQHTAFWVMESIRLDLGFGSQVHP